MTCHWQHSDLKDGAIGRPCGKEGHPLCEEHQFIADVLEETESVTSDIREHGETALIQWREEIGRLRLLVGHADELTPAALVKRVHEALPELQRAALNAVIYRYINSRPEDDRYEDL